MDLEKKLADNFTYKELMCPCCKRCEMQDYYMLHLQLLRDRVGVPFRITSGFRCTRHNEEIGGFPRSQHLAGNACDISTLGWKSEDLYRLLQEAITVGFKGIGIGYDFVHLDCRTGNPKMWVYS